MSRTWHPPSCTLRPVVGEVYGDIRVLGERGFVGGVDGYLSACFVVEREGALYSMEMANREEEDASIGYLNNLRAQRNCEKKSPYLRDVLHAGRFLIAGEKQTFIGPNGEKGAALDEEGRMNLFVLRRFHAGVSELEFKTLTRSGQLPSGFAEEIFRQALCAAKEFDPSGGEVRFPENNVLGWNGQLSFPRRCMHFVRRLPFLEWREASPAPEVLRETTWNPESSPSWYAAFLTYRFLTGDCPFGVRSGSPLPGLQAIMDGKPDFKATFATGETGRLLRLAFEPDATIRITADAILLALSGRCMPIAAVRAFVVGAFPELCRRDLEIEQQVGIADSGPAVGIEYFD